MEGVVSIFPNRLLQLHTTRSWDFMGFSETVKRNPTVESDTIIGVLTLESGLNYKALVMKVLVQFQKNGKVFVKAAKISLATS